jgi:hypothetical protein
MSPRVVHFGKHEVMWHCRSASYTYVTKSMQTLTLLIVLRLDAMGSAAKVKRTNFATSRVKP